MVHQLRLLRGMTPRLLRGVSTLGNEMRLRQLATRRRLLFENAGWIS
jgi:hypothetical protein